MQLIKRLYAAVRTASAFGLVALLALVASPASAQNVSVNPGAGSYATLADAFAAINTGIHTGAITVSITADTTEPATGAVLNASGSGAASYTSVLITPAGARTVSGAATAGLPLIDLNGADNVTINGLNASGNSLTVSNTTASATSGTSTIRLIGGATGNTITNATILGSASMSAATNGGTIFISTDANTPNGNDNNTISNNNLGPAGGNLPTKAVSCNGSQSTTAIGNSGIVVTNNNIFDFFGAAVTSSGVHVANGCNTISVTNNRFYQTATRTWTTGAMHRAIDINSSSATFGAQGITITGNVIGFASSTQTGVYTLTGSTGKFTGIFLAAISNGAGIAPSTISNNTVAAVSMTGVTSSGTGTTGSPIIGIMALNGQITTEDNTIGSQSATGSIVLSTNTSSNLEVHGIYNFSVDNWTARRNTVGGISLTNAGTSNIVFFGMRANTGGGLNWVAESNIIGGNVANSIQSTSSGTGSALIGMVSNNAITTATSNTVRNLTSNSGNSTGTTASVIGMMLTSTTAAAPNVLQRNTINNLTNTSSTNAVTVTGMQLTGPGAFTNVITRNSISNLSVVSSSTSAAVNGINFAGGVNNLSNNFVRLGQDAAGADITNGTAFSGINELLGTNIFNHNTVLIQGSGVAGTLNTFALNSTVTVNTRSYRNNIFVNTRSNGAGTGKHYAARYGGSSPLPAGLSANNNLHFVGGTGGVLGFFNLLDHATLAAFQAATGVDAGSISADPLLVSATNLRLTVGSPARDVGSNSVGVTEDFDGKARPGANALFDMGADEFDGIAPEPNDIAATAFIDPANGGARPAGLAFTVSASFTNAGTLPQTSVPVRYRILDAANVEVYNQTTTIASLNSLATATATFPNATLAVGNYTIIAIAELATDTRPSNNTITGTLQVLPPLSGVYTVGAGGDFASLTNAGGAFDRINSLGGTGAVRFNILGDLSGETGTFVLNQVIGGASVSIRPAASVTAAVTGSINGCLIRLNGADNVTIDGSNTDGGTTRNLSFQNTNAGTGVGVICLSSLGAGAGANNNTIRNLSVSGNDPTTSLIGISVGGATAGSGGPNNNGTLIQNVSVRRVIFGIFSSGDNTVLNTGTVIRNNDLTGLAADRIRRVGILVFNDDGTQITGNRIAGVDSNESADSIGIGVGTQDANNAATVVGGGVINALVAQNEISGVASQSTTGFSAVGVAIAGGATGTNTIANNTIRGVIGPATSPDFVAGIFVAGATGSTTRVVYNSILLSGDRGTVASQVPSHGIAHVGTSGANLELRNNIVVNTQTSSGGTNATSFAFGTGASSFANLTASNNLYFTSGANASGFRSGSLTAAAGGAVINHATLAAWAAASGDTSTLFTDPLYVSATDLNIQPTSPAINAGVSVPGITTDIVGTLRLSPPEIGAFEVPEATLSISPTSIDFGNVPVGTTTAPQTVTLSNTGNASLTVDPLTAAAAPFARAGGTCSAPPITLTAGSSCTLTYTFAPTVTGAANQTLTVTSSGTGSGTIALTGNGVQGNLTITPGSVNFGSVNVGTPSAEETVTLANTGTATLDVTALTAAAAPFARTGTGTCSASLPITITAGSSCTLTYTFTPAVVGPASQNLTVTANAPGSGTIALSGTGVAAEFSVTPNPVAFGNQVVGTTSGPLIATLANTGTGSLSVTALPDPAAPFARTGGTCAAAPFTLAPSTSCTVIYTFAPAAVGPATGSVAIGSSVGPVALSLTGTGIQGNLVIAPATVPFGNQPIGSTSAPQSVTLSNTGTASLDVTALTTAAAPFARAGGTCGASPPITLTPGGSCTLTYTFAPTATGVANQVLTVTANAPGSGTITLSGTGTPAADLSIVKTSAVNLISLGLIQYNLVVANAGPSAVTGAVVADTFPVGLTNVLWSCVGVGGGSCVANGTGNINQLVDLPNGATVVFSITANVPLPLPNAIVNTATVTAPSGTTDPVLSNNTSTVNDVILIFADGFESAALAVTLPETASGEVRMATVPAEAINLAASGVGPRDAIRYQVAGASVIVQARRIGDSVQVRSLAVDAAGEWTVGAWVATSGAPVLLEWSTGAAVGGRTPVSARLRLGN